MEIIDVSYVPFASLFLWILIGIAGIFMVVSAGIWMYGSIKKRATTVNSGIAGVVLTAFLLGVLAALGNSAEDNRVSIALTQELRVKGYENVAEVRVRSYFTATDKDGQAVNILMTPTPENSKKFYMLTDD